MRELDLLHQLAFHAYHHGGRKRSLKEKSEKENLVVMGVERYNYIHYASYMQFL